MSTDPIQNTFSNPKHSLRAVMRYAMLPDILPRIRALGFHFGHFAYLIAIVLRSARLFPANHSFLNPTNIGQFGVRQVLAAAANNITWSTRNIDQIAIFSAVVIGIILIVLQVVLTVFYAFIGTAHAQTSTSFFETPDANVKTDVVLIFLEQVFGPNLSIFGAATQPLGTPVYEGIHSVLSIFSMATMIIAVIIVLYFIMTVVGEAAKTGTPFGQRFNTLWAPIRLVVALGLLVPLGSGLNSAQYITLGIAKMGSGLGTVVWTTFVEEVTAATDIVAKPAGESTSALVQRIFLNQVCAASFNRIELTNDREISIRQVTGRRTSVASPDFSDPTSMVEAARKAGQTSIELSWSPEENGGKATDYACGRITVSLTDYDVFNDGEATTLESEKWWWNLPIVGKDMDEKLGEIHEQVKISYLKEIKRISDELKLAGEAIAANRISVNSSPDRGDDSKLDFIPDLLKQTAIDTQKNINATIVATYQDITGSDYAKSGGYDEMVKRGWGAAGMWYGTLGTINKRYMDAISSAIPTLDTLFSAEEVQENERGALGRLFGVSRYNISGGATKEIEQAISMAQNDYAGYVVEVQAQTSPLYEDAIFKEAHADGKSGWLSTSLIWVLGGNQLRHLKNDPTLDPMVRLTSSGHAMVTRSVVMAGLGSALAVGGTIASMAPSPKSKFVGELAGAASGFFFAFAAIAFTAGVFLAFVLPIIPFVYFAFAVIGWVLEIFEAVVAMPLWALAHLRIDGEGMPGSAAIGGYQLLLMILLRPALIVVGLVGGYVIFGAAMFFMSTLFNSATAITQSDISSNSMGAIGIFVYTIIFIFLTYNIALMCFKMIDDVPKGILRWMGASAQPFSDSRSDPIGGAREVLVGAAAGAAVMRTGIGSTKQGITSSRIRDKKRKMGVDPDTGASIDPGTGKPI